MAPLRVEYCHLGTASVRWNINRLTMLSYAWLRSFHRARHLWYNFGLSPSGCVCCSAHSAVVCPCTCVSILFWLHDIHNIVLASDCWFQSPFYRLRGFCQLHLETSIDDTFEVALRRSSKGSPSMWVLLKIFLLLQLCSVPGSPWTSRHFAFRLF